MTQSKIVGKSSEALPFRRKWLERGLLLAALLSAAVAMSPHLADADLWGHVQYGRDALSQGLPATTTYSYTADGHTWINHENLAELLLAAGAKLGGSGLLVFKFLASLFVLGLIIHHGMRQGLGSVAVCLMLLLVGVNLSRHWSVRPQLLTYVYYTIMIFLLMWAFQGWQGRWHLRLFDRRRKMEPSEELFYSARRLRYLWLAPILFVFWANSHGGFVAGFCIYSAYLTLRGFEAFTCRGWKAWGLIHRFALMILVAGLATLINPYGPNLHAWLFESLLIPRPEITEWHPPNLLSLTELPLWLAMGTWAVVMFFTRRGRDFTHLIILTLTLWQSLEHQRHVPFFIIAFAFWMSVHLESALSRFNISKKDTSFGEGMNRPLRWTLGIGLCLAYGLLGGKLYERLSEMPVPYDQYPVAAVQYMADHDLNGRVVVTYNWAQYVIAALGTDDPENKPGVTVGFDGRFRTCYPQEVVDMHFDLILGDCGKLRYRSPTSLEPDGGRVLRYGRPDLVLLNRYQPHSELVMWQHRDEWVLLYQDKMAQLWGRSAKYDQPESPHHVPPYQRRITSAPQTGEVAWPALPKRRDRHSLQPSQTAESHPSGTRETTPAS